MANPVTNNILALAGGTAQAVGGAVIITAAGWTGIGAAGGGILLAQGSFSARVAMGNLLNLLLIQTDPGLLLQNSGIGGGFASALTSNNTVINTAVAVDISTNLMAGGLAVLRANQAIFSNSSAAVGTVKVVRKGGEQILTTSRYSKAGAIVNATALPGAVSTATAALAKEDLL